MIKSELLRKQEKFFFISFYNTDIEILSRIVFVDDIIDGNFSEVEASLILNFYSKYNSIQLMPVVQES